MIIYIYIHVITTIAGTRHDSTKNLLKKAQVKITTKSKILFFCWKKHEWNKNTHDGLKEVLLLGLEGVMALVTSMKKKMGDTFETLTSTATKVGTRAKVGDGSKITWWEQ